MTNKFNYSEIEIQFINLFDLVKNKFTYNEINEVKEFIAVREYGLAFQTFLDIANEENKQLSEDEFCIVKRIAQLMSVNCNIN